MTSYYPGFRMYHGIGQPGTWHMGNYYRALDKEYLTNKIKYGLKNNLSNTELGNIIREETGIDIKASHIQYWINKYKKYGDLGYRKKCERSAKNEY